MNSPLSGNQSAASAWKHGMQLAAFALGAGVLLVFADSLTKAQITSQQLQSQRQTLNQVMPAALHDNDLLASSFQLGPHSSGYQQLELLGLSSVRTGYLATSKGKTSGVILPLETSEGFGGNIVMVIGLTPDGSIAGVRVLQHGETPGLGDNIDVKNSAWITSFDHHSLADTPMPHWTVKMDGGDFDQFVGATITPRAVISAVYSALLFFDANKSRLLANPPPSDQHP